MELDRDQGDCQRKRDRESSFIRSDFMALFLKSAGTRGAGTESSGANPGRLSLSCSIRIMLLSRDFDLLMAQLGSAMSSDSGSRHLYFG